MLGVAGSGEGGEEESGELHGISAVIPLYFFVRNLSRCGRVIEC